MDLLRLGQLYNAADLTKEQKLELAKTIDISRSIPNDTSKKLPRKSFVGYNCLHIAAIKLDLDFVFEFLKQGADFLKQGALDLRTPIHVAVYSKRNFKNRNIWEISGKLQECQIVYTLLLAHVKSNNPFNPKCKNGLSHLHIACMFNCVEAVTFFLKNGETINHITSADSYWPSYSPLHFAVRYSSLETVEILVHKGADLLAKNGEGSTALDLLITRLINLANYVNIRQYAMCTPYEEELRRIEAIASIFMQLKSENEVNIFEAETGLTNFHLACTFRDSSIAASFLDNNFDLNLSVKTDSKFWPGWTPLHFAACSSAVTAILLIQKGADITIKNAKGKTPLDFCLERYTPEILHSILSAKEEFKKVLLSDSSSLLLNLILAMNDITSFKEYLETLDYYDISVSSTSPIFAGYNLLHLAVSMNPKIKSWNHFVQETDTQKNIDSFSKVYNNADDESFSEKIHVCFSVGFSVDFKNNDGFTPIHLALKTLSRSDIFEKLLYHCYENVVDPDNISHLHIACAVGSQSVVQNFLTRGANIDATTKRSFQWYKNLYLSSDIQKPDLLTVNAKSTPLHIAVAFGHSNIIDLLLNHGADVYATDSERYTPIHLSIAHESNELARMILSTPQVLIDLMTKEGLTHMHVAAFAGDAAAITMLICNGSNVNSPIDLEVPTFLSRFAGKTPLQIATQSLRGNTSQAVEALMEFGADIYTNDAIQCLMDESDFDVTRPIVNRLKLNENVNEPIDSSGLTLLHVACSTFDVNWALELLNKGANVNARIKNDEDYKGLWKGYTPLHALVSRKYRNTDFVIQTTADELGKLLLEKGADVTIDSEDGTPLHIAYCDYMRKKHGGESPQELQQDPLQSVSHQQGLPPGLVLELARRRLEGLVQEQPQVAFDEDMPLEEAFQNPAYMEEQRRLFQQLGRGQEIAQPVNTLHERSRNDDLASLMLYSQRTYQINPISPDGFSHFHFFCTCESEVVAKQFLDNGVDINHVTSPFSEIFAGYNALHFAIKFEAFRVVNLLIERGADVNVANAEGNIPLHLMIMQDLIDTQISVILALAEHGANFNARNLQGETPADILLTKNNFTYKQLKFLLTNGSTISIKKSISLPGPVGLIMRNALAAERINIFGLFVSNFDVQTAVKIGYDPIQDIFKPNHNFAEFTDNDYLNILLEFIYVGCEIDQVDDRGCTALHNSIILDNIEAVYALIQVGADVNACNVNCQTFESGSKWKIEAHLAFQVHKMHVLGLYVSNASNSFYHQYTNKVPIEEDMETNIVIELENADAIQLTEKLTARAFLSELWGIVYYSDLPREDRQAIDTFFNDVNYLIQEFPLLCGIMISQYRKAVVRPKLIESAKGVLVTEGEMYMPDMCLEEILNYFTNDDLKYLIKDSNVSENLYKRARIY